MKKVINNKITIDKLAQMVAKGFGSVDKRFDSIEKRLDSHESILKITNLRIDGIESDIKDIKNNIKSVTDLSFDNSKDISSLDVRATRLEKQKVK